MKINQLQTLLQHHEQQLKEAETRANAVCTSMTSQIIIVHLSSTVLCSTQAENDALEREKELSEALERQRLLENVSSTIICAVLSSQVVLQF